MYFSDDSRAQRVVQVAQAFEHPRLALPERHFVQSLEEGISDPLVG